MEGNSDEGDHQSEQEIVAEIESDFRDVFGYWEPGLERVARSSPEYMRKLILTGSHTCDGTHLPVKVRELIFMAICGSSSNPQMSAMRRHVQTALEHGATEDDLLYVCRMLSGQGRHSLHDEVETAVEVIGERDYTDEQMKRIERLDDALDVDVVRDMGMLDPDWFTVSLRWSQEANRMENTTLDEKHIELIWAAANASPGHRFSTGFEAHLENAKEKGATKEEMAETLKIVSMCAVSPAVDAFQIVDEELEKHDEN